MGRKWITGIISSQETSTPVEIVLTDALVAEGFFGHAAARADALADPAVDDGTRPILLAVSDNGPQTSSGLTREFAAMTAARVRGRLARHPDRPVLDLWLQRPSA